MVAGDKTVPVAVIEFQDFRFDPTERRLYRNGEQIKVTPKPLSALEFLIENRHRAVPKDELLNRVWGGVRTAGAVEHAISYLRKALADDPLEPRYIATVPGQGYRWIAKMNLAVATNAADQIERTSLVAEQPAAISTRDLTIGRPFWLSRVFLVTVASAAIIIAGLAVTFAVRHRAAPDHLAHIALRGDTLIAMSDTERVLWEYVFDTPLREDLPGQPAWRKQIVDLNHDGDKQVLVAVEYNVEARGPHELFCFSSRGKVLWRYQPRLDAEFRTKDLNGPWHISHLIVVSEGQSSSIWMAINHSVWWPAFMVRISSVGTPRIMFVSSGMITELRRIQNHSGSYILASGVNNEYRAASLAVVAQDGPPVISPQSAGSPYECVLNCPAGKPYRYFLFPRLELDAFSKVPYNVAAHLVATGDGVMVETAEVREDDLPPGFSSYYGISRELYPTSAAFGDSHQELHQAFEKRRLITHSFANCPERNTPADVKVADENGRWGHALVARARY